MAAIVIARTIRAYDPTQVTLDQLHKRAGYTGQTVLAGSNTIDVPEAALRKLYGKPQFEIFGTTDTNTAAASSPAINLTTEGVIFPANTYRDIEVETIAFGGTNRYKFRTRQRVLGSATAPTLVGQEEFLTNCEAALSCTSANGVLMTEAADCIGPGWWDGAAPVAADVSSNAFVVSWLGASNPVRLLFPGAISNADAAPIAADSRIFQHAITSLANGTSTVTINDAAVPALADLTAATAIRVLAKLLPPVHTPLFIDTGTAPDSVLVGALGISSDVTTWHIKVFVGDLITCGPLV